MKSSTLALRNLLATGEFQRADLYTLTLVDGTVQRWTSADTVLRWGGSSFPPLNIVRDRTKSSLGLSIDQLKVTIYPLGTDTIGGLPVGQAVRAGVLDGAVLLLQKAYLSTWPTIVGVVHGFQGKISDVDGSRTEFHLMLKSGLELLNIDMPREVYQSTCLHTVYDAGCTLLRSSFTITGTVTGTPTLNSVASALGHASGYFEQGVLAFTSGACNGSRRTVKTFASGLFTFALPLPAVPSAGDTFAVYPGCDRRQVTCGGKFSNSAHFKGYPYAPTPETAF